MNDIEWLHLAKEKSQLRIKLDRELGTSAFIAWGANPYVVIAEVRTYHRKGNITNVVAYVYKRGDPYSRSDVVARMEFKKKKEAFNWCEVTARLLNA